MSDNSIKRSGVILVLSGPSGAGKSTACNVIIEEDCNLAFSVSCTTRQPREGELDGVHYNFISKEVFLEKVDNDEFVEWAEVHGNYYGTLISEVLGKAKQGKDVLLDIDVQGARLMRKACEVDAELANCVEYVFAAPPSFEELERRLRGRGTETDESLQRRLTNAKGELEAWAEYDHLLLLDTPEQGQNDLRALLTTLRNKSKRITESPFHG